MELGATRYAKSITFDKVRGVLETFMENCSVKSMLMEIVGLQISVEGSIGINSYCPYHQFPQGIGLLSGNQDAGLDASVAGVGNMAYGIISCTL